MEPTFSPWKAKGAATPRRWLSQYTQCSPSSFVKTGHAGDDKTKTKNKKKRGGAHSDVFIVQSTRRRGPDEKRRFYAIKRQALITVEAKKRAVREQKIAEELKKLVYRSMCGNFVLLHDWNSCETYAEPGFATPSRSTSSTSSTSTSSPSSTLVEKMSWLGGTPTKSPATPLRGKRGRPLPHGESPAKYEFMHFVLEYGEKTLASCLKEVDLAQYREILWQVLYALYVAGKTFSFSHYDLHHKNILLSSLPVEKGCYVYYHKGVAYYNQTCIVKIADFGLSRIATEEGETLCNTKNALGQTYAPEVDVMSVVGWPWKNMDPDRDQDPNHKQLQSLQRLMRKGSRPAALLNHPFFAPLKEMPEAFSTERCVAVSSDGLPGIPAEFHARALATCAPPTPSAGRSSSGSSGNNSPNTPTTRSPGGFAVPASPYHSAGPSGLRLSFAKPRQPFTPSSTIRMAIDEEEDSADLKGDEPTPKKARRMSEPTTPSSAAPVKSESSTPTTQQPSAEEEEQKQQPKKRRRFAKRTRPPKPSFLAAPMTTDDSDNNNNNKENTPNQSENIDTARAAKKAKREEAPEAETEQPEASDRESDDDAASIQPARRSNRAKKVFTAYSPREKRKAISSRRKGTAR